MKDTTVEGQVLDTAEHKLGTSQACASKDMLWLEHQLHLHRVAMSCKHVAAAYYSLIELAT